VPFFKKSNLILISTLEVVKMSSENLLNANDIVAYLKTITKEEHDELVIHCKKITKRKKKLKEKKPIEQEPKEQEQQEQKDPNAVDLQITQMRLSLFEFKERLGQKLPYHRIQLLLRQAGCRKLYRSLYGDISKIVLAEGDDFDANDPIKEEDSDEKSFSLSPGEYLKIFISILKKLNTPKNDDRIHFHEFIDACWTAVDFDTLSRGSHHLVFEQETGPSSSYLMANLLKPNKLREHFIDYIKQYFIAGTELDFNDIDASIRKQIDDEFKGFGSIIISMSNYHFNLCAIMILDMFKQFCRRGTKYKSRFYRYFRSEKGMVTITKTKRRTKAAILLENLKDNKVIDNQDAELSSKYSENRNITVTSVSAPISETNYWPPEEGDNLRPILPCRKGNGSLDVDFFTEEMENIYGRVSGKVSPSIPVTSKHIHQLTALQNKLPPVDRSFVEVWIRILQPYEKKEGNFCKVVFI
jgi:hypothetical protein